MTAVRSRPARVSLAWLVAAALIAALAAAAPLDSLAGRRGGSGTLEGSGGSQSLSEAEVRLREGGTAEITVRDRGTAFRFLGTWRKDPGDYIKLQIGEAFGRPAEASGWVLVRGGRFEQIEIDGRTEGGRKLALSFTATGRDLPIEPDWAGSDQTAEGWGELERAQRRAGVERVRVELRPDGGALVTLSADGTQRIAGTWSDREEDSVRIQVREAFGDGRADGGGQVRYRRGEIERIDLDGSLSSGGFRVRFEAGARPPRPPANGRFRIEYGFDQRGGDYRDLGASDVDACQEACASESRCRAFTFNTRTHRCYLKDAERPLERRSDAVSGVKLGEGGDGGRGLTERFGWDMRGGDYTSVRLDALDQCQDACRRDRQCRAYTYITRDRMCYLKDRLSDYQQNRDAVSGEKSGGY